jgi:hypothetical protein
MAMKTLPFMFSLLLCYASFAQNLIPRDVVSGEVQVTKLYFENIKSSKQVEIKAGDILRYKKVGSPEYVKGKVIEFTSIRILFENKRKEIVSILYKDLETLKIPRSPWSRIGGVTLIVAGAAGFMGGLSLTTQNNNGIGGSTVKSSGQGLAIGGLAALVGGFIIILPKQIDLQKSWVVKTTGTTQ